MKRYIIGILAATLVLALISFTAVFAESGAVSYHKITAEQGKTLMDEGNAIVVDVRRSDEYESGHIPGAINIPNESITDKKPTSLPDKDAIIIIYCRTGVRSKSASDKLINIGYTDVYDMGGIVDWPYETVLGDEPGVYEVAQRGILSSFEAYDLYGDKIDQSILKDYDLTMINVWGTFCGPCLSEMPMLGKVARDYESEGFQIIGLVGDAIDQNGEIQKSQVELAQKQVKETKADYTHILPSMDLYGILYQISAYPTSFFVDSNGRQVGIGYVGSMDEETCVQLINQAFEELDS